MADKLIIKIDGDTKGFETSIKGLGDKTSQALDSAKNIGTKAIKGIAIGAAAATTAVVGLATAAVKSYAEYEQLIGGVNKLFGDSSKTVQDYAAGAYKTAGLSANKYMETMTSFAASLIHGLGGDTAEAARIGNMAITDMSDNVNMMGSSMESVQDAYKGFAKQNYTMLDNLKLGYGGTKTEMVRLINDSGILGKKISNLNGITFDQMIKAIHKVQENLKITGTTAAEAEGTISGSANAAKAAWSNLVVGMADDNADMEVLIKNFVDSVGTLLKNLIPRVGKVFKTISGIAIEQVKKLTGVDLGELFEPMITTFKAIAEALSNGTMQMAWANFIGWMGGSAEEGNRFRIAMDYIFGDDLGGKITEFATNFKGVFDWIMENKDAIIGALSGMAIAFSALLVISKVSALLTSLTSPLGLVMIAAAALGAAWVTNFGGIRDITEKVFKFILENKEDVIGALIGIGTAVAGFKLAGVAKDLGIIAAVSPGIAVAILGISAAAAIWKTTQFGLTPEQLESYNGYFKDIGDSLGTIAGNIPAIWKNMTGTSTIEQVGVEAGNNTESVSLFATALERVILAIDSFMEKLANISDAMAGKEIHIPAVDTGDYFQSFGANNQGDLVGLTGTLLQLPTETFDEINSIFKKQTGYSLPSPDTEEYYKVISPSGNLVHWTEETFTALNDILTELDTTGFDEWSLTIIRIANGLYDEIVRHSIIPDMVRDVNAEFDGWWAGAEPGVTSVTDGIIEKFTAMAAKLKEIILSLTGGGVSTEGLESGLGGLFVEGPSAGLQPTGGGLLENLFKPVPQTVIDSYGFLSEAIKLLNIEVAALNGYFGGGEDGTVGGTILSGMTAISDFAAGAFTESLDGLGVFMVDTFIPNADKLREALYLEGGGGNTLYNALGSVQGVTEDIIAVFLLLVDIFKVSFKEGVDKVIIQAGILYSALEPIEQLGRSIADAFNGALIAIQAVASAMSDMPPIPYASGSVGRIGKDYPEHAWGGWTSMHGLTLVGERGPELISTSRMMNVWRNDDIRKQLADASADMMRSRFTGGGQQNISASSTNDNSTNVNFGTVFGDEFLEQKMEAAVRNMIRKGVFLGA